MKNTRLILLTAMILFFAGTPVVSSSQAVVLSADGPGNTYELINSVLAPGYNAVEHPECAHGSFGRHIAEVYDATLGKHVFEFYAHVAEDNDRCINFDRQRTEIKTYDQSPANLIATPGETVTYKWKFKIPVGFQPSPNFTHLHQVKAVGGADDDPIITFTARKATPNRLEFIHNNATQIGNIPLSAVEGIWVEATEILTVGTNGKYAVTLRKVSDGASLFSYSNNSIVTIRPDNNFVRPKWGIYRSLNSSINLRDEAVRFSDFSIEEGPVAAGQVYYWIGGTTTTSFSANTNWNTQLDGLGDSRSVLGPLPDDVLIFDGTNVGGTIPTTGTVTATVSGTTGTTFAQLRLQSNASVILQRPAGAGSSGTLTVAGDGTSAPDLEISAGSSLTLNSPLVDGNVVIVLGTGNTGLISGTVTFSNTGGHRFQVQSTEALVFASGAIFNSDGVSTVYPFSTSTQGSVQNGVVFQSGANLVLTGNRSPFANTSTYQSCNMQPGSNFYVRTSNAASTGSYTNLKTFGNIIVQNNSTFTADGPFYKIDNLTIDAGSAVVLHSSGNTPILGNLTVNGSLTAPGGSSNIVIMGGSSPQIISGSGTIAIPSFTVANYSDVQLNKLISVGTTINIVGKLNFGTNGQIGGTGNFTSRVAGSAATITGNTVAGSYLLTGIVGALSGNAGLAITGTGLDANTNVAGFASSQATINLGKPALSTETGATFTFHSDSATLVTNTTNGMDPVNGAVIVSGTKSFQSGTNYIINAATTSPFGISTTATTSMTMGDVLLNADVTSNYNTRIRGTLTLGDGRFTIRPLDTVRILSGNPIEGAPFSSAKYIINGVSGNDAGVLRYDNFSTPRLFPVGSATNYLPALVSPSEEMSMAVNVFEGVTTDGTPAGTPLTPQQKDTLVDAVWNINRVGAGGGDATVQLSWPGSLEGSAFAGFSNAQIGIGAFDGLLWTAPIGTGDNNQNIATANFTEFFPFVVSQVEGVVPVQFTSIQGMVKTGGIEVRWDVANEINISRYEVERSYTGTGFVYAGSVNASGSSHYSFMDNTDMAATIFYRIKIISADGSVSYSSIVLVKPGSNHSISLYPNPASGFVNVIGLKGNSVVKIVNASGQVFRQLPTRSNTVNLDISALKPGWYLVEIFSEGKKLSTVSFVKQ